MNNKVFLTGATGLLGSYLLKLLIENGNQVYVLARGKNGIDAGLRIKEILKFWDGSISNSFFKNIHIVEGDITQPNLGLKKDIWKKLIKDINLIFHSAALPELRKELEAIRKINVGGAKNVLDFACECKKIKLFNHISTAYVVGDKQGIRFSEDMLELGQGFYNTYEQSKFEAEVMTKKYVSKGLKISTFRPSMVMGDSIEGKTLNFRLFYEPLHFFSLGLFDEFPADLKSTQNLINIDTVANIILLLGEHGDADTYHVTSNYNDNLNLESFLALAAEYFGIRMPKFVQKDKFDFSRWTFIQKTLAEAYVPYFNYSTKFSSERTQKALSKLNFIMPAIDKDNILNIFQYCAKIGFIKKDGYGDTRVNKKKMHN